MANSNVHTNIQTNIKNMVIAIHDLDQGAAEAVNISEDVLFNMFDARLMDMDKVSQETVRELIEFFVTTQDTSVNVLDYSGNLNELEDELLEMADLYKLEITIV